MKKIRWVIFSIIFFLILCACGKETDPSAGYQDKDNLNLRDTGPAGGLIFYVNVNGNQDGWKYLEAASVDHTSKEWGTYGFFVTDAGDMIAGSGKQNSLDIAGFDTGKTDKVADVMPGL